jgi:hypothetical protein
MAEDQKSEQRGDEAVRGRDVLTRIAIDCLKCGHCTSVAEEKLAHFGIEPKGSLVTLSKRLVCKVCGSKAVQTYRYVEDPDGPTLVPHDGT